MKALSLCVLVLSLAALAAAVESAQACSCAMPDPRSALAAGDGAFVGTMVSRRETADSQAILTFEVERALKGSIGKRVEVVTARDSAGCGLEMPVGTRTGLVLDRRDGAWHGGLCAQFSPADLLAAALPLPAPNGKGPVALVVGGQFGPVRTIALDRKGRTLAYGKGQGTTGLLSVCPGGRRLVEVSQLAPSVLAVRETSSLRLVRQHALHLPGKRLPYTVRCANASGATVLVFAGAGGDSGLGAAIYRLVGPRATLLWRGTGQAADLTGPEAHVYAGASGEPSTLVAVDLRTRRTTTLAALPECGLSLVRDATGAHLAGVAACNEGRPQVFVADLGRRPVKVHAATLVGESPGGSVLWLPEGRLAFLPWYGRGRGRVLDTSLRTVSRFTWTAGNGALVGAKIFGLGANGTLIAADLPSGPTRTIRRLPSPTAYVIVAA